LGVVEPMVMVNSMHEVEPATRNGQVESILLEQPVYQQAVCILIVSLSWQRLMVIVIDITRGVHSSTSKQVAEVSVEPK